MEITKIRLCEREDEFPRVDVILENKTYTLVPFRGYCFQVCGADGTGDYGASAVIGLKHTAVARMRGYGYQSNEDSRGIQKELLRGQALIAIDSFCRYMSTDDRLVISPKLQHRWCGADSEVFDAFLEKCIDYFK